MVATLYYSSSDKLKIHADFLSLIELTK